jgi:hypothetical protein
MKRYVVEIVETITYKMECSAVSPECAERFVRDVYDSGVLKGTGELESVSFDVEEKEGE